MSEKSFTVQTVQSTASKSEKPVTLQTFESMVSKSEKSVTLQTFESTVSKSEKPVTLQTFDSAVSKNQKTVYGAIRARFTRIFVNLLARLPRSGNEESKFYVCNTLNPFFGAFTKLRKATVLLSIRPSASNNSVPTGGIFKKFDI
jgi:hypothetical protein